MQNVSLAFVFIYDLNKVDKGILFIEIFIYWIIYWYVYICVKNIYEKNGKYVEIYMKGNIRDTDE